MEKVGIDLIKNLDSEKYNNFIICLDELGPFGETLKKEGYNIVAFNKGDGYKLRILLSLIKYLRNNNIKIVHTNNPSPHFWGGLAATFAGIKSRIHTKHGRNFVTVKRKVMINRFSALFSKKIISVSKDSAMLTKKIERVPQKKIKVILNGVDTTVFVNSGKNESLLESFGIEKGKFVIGSISRFSVDKDYETLIKAFNEIQRSNSNVHLLLVGDGETKAEMVKLAESLKLMDKITFSGFRTDILDLLNSMDVFVLSTHTEGISIALLEAMSTERPVVATNVGGNGEIVQDNDNGFLVEENDVNGLAQAISKIVDDKEIRTRLAHSARETVEKKFSLRNTVAQYEEIYSKCLMHK